MGLAFAPAPFQRLNLLAVRLGDRHRHVARKEEISGVTGADFDLIALAAEALNGLD